jgi:hypothetical protein
MFTDETAGIIQPENNILPGLLPLSIHFSLFCISITLDISIFRDKVCQDEALNCGDLCNNQEPANLKFILS